VTLNDGRRGYAGFMSDPNTDRERLADETMGKDPKPDPGGPWAKTSSGDAEATTTDATGGVAGGLPELDRDLPEGEDRD
jgi:hypothetical protein